MITLTDVTRVHASAGGPQPILNRVCLNIGARDRVGVIGAGNSGKSTLIRLIAGAEYPDEGQIERTGAIGWPLGTSFGIHPDLTGAENVRLLAAIAGLDADHAVAFVGDFAELGPYYHRTCVRYSPGMRAQLAFAFSLVGRPDIYLADEIISAGDAHFRVKCEALLDLRLDGAGLFLVTKHTRSLERFCSRFFALVRGALLECETAGEAADLISLDQSGGLA
ncbi:MAG: ATP-binding cassette domain-containing protein [Pseudomonadota bacterium]